MSVATTDTDVRVRAGGLRATRPRRLVLEAVEALGGHRSADDIADAVAATGQHLPRTSVYNALADLESAGLVRSGQWGGRSRSYEPVGEPHHHFVCRSCGAVDDVHLPRGTAVPRVRPPAGALAEETAVVVTGLCAACRRAPA